MDLAITMNFFFPFLKESSGSARTDYRAIQLAKRKKQKGPAAKGVKNSSTAGTLASGSGRFGEGPASTTTAGLTIRDPVTGVQYVQIQLLQVSRVGSVLLV